jgi:Zn-dependent membrane protease YugP
MAFSRSAFETTPSSAVSMIACSTIIAAHDIGHALQGMNMVVGAALFLPGGITVKSGELLVGLISIFL